MTLIAIGGFAAAVALGLLAIGPWAMDLLFGNDTDYGRFGLALIAVGMGFYLAAATLNQAALAHGRTKQAAACWLVSAAAFVAFMLIPGWDDRVVQLEIGYAARRGASVRTFVLALPPTGVESPVGDGHAHPHLPALRGHVRPADRDGQRHDQVDPGRRGRRFQPRLHLPEGARAEGAPRGPGPPPPAARPPRWRAAAGDVGRGVARDRGGPRAAARRARPQRGRGLPRQPVRAQPGG